MKRKATMLVILATILIMLCSCNNHSSLDYNGGVTVNDVAQWDGMKGEVGFDESISDVYYSDGDGVQTQQLSDSMNIVLSEEKLVYHAELTIRCSDWEGDISRVETMLNGVGVVMDSRNLSQYDGTRYLRIQARVQKDSLNDLLEQLGEIGHTTSSNVYTDNITQQYYDVQTRMKNAQERVDRLQELLEQAVNVTEVMDVYQELESAQDSLDYLKTQLLNMETDVQWSYLNIRLEDTRRVNDYGDVIGDGSWLSNRWYDVQQAMYSFLLSVTALVTFLIYLLPYAAVILVIWLLLHFTPAGKRIISKWRKYRAGRKERKKKVVYVVKGDERSGNGDEGNDGDGQ